MLIYGDIMYVKQRTEIEKAEKKLLQALPFFLINLLIPPIVLFFLQKFIVATIIYSFVCLISTLLLITLRKTLEDYSLDDFMKLSKYVSILGFVSGLVLGGFYVSEARKYIDMLLVKKNKNR